MYTNKLDIKQKNLSNDILKLITVKDRLKYILSDIFMQILIICDILLLILFFNGKSDFLSIFASIGTTLTTIILEIIILKPKNLLLKKMIFNDYF